MGKIKCKNCLYYSIDNSTFAPKCRCIDKEDKPISMIEIESEDFACYYYIPGIEKEIQYNVPHLILEEILYQKSTATAIESLIETINMLIDNNNR